MHISEGVLTAPVLGAGAALTAVGVAVGLKKIDYDQLPRVALLAAVFFVASLVRVPLGPANVHLYLGGLVGLLLGWGAFPAMLAALALQAVLFQFGGLVVLGVNTFNMAMPALLCFWLFGRLARGGGRGLAIAAGFGAGALATLLAAGFTALALYLSGGEFIQAAQALVIAHLPVAAVEGALVALAVGFLRQVRPGVLGTTA